MHSHLRAQQGSREMTEYCPLDLFSGDECRILKAIHNLWNGWVSSNATINNLKIFAEGKFLTPSEVCLNTVYSNRPRLILETSVS